jgi:hypothetical protein
MNGHHIDSRNLEAFLDSLNEPRMDAPCLEQCGITEKWLSRNSKEAVEEVIHRKVKSLSPRQVELFMTHFTDGSIAQRAYETMFESLHTDDSQK